MKKAILFVWILCLCFAVSGAACAETPAAEMTAEELYQAGLEAFDAEDYGKALELLQQAADAGHAEAWTAIGFQYDMGLGVEQDYGKAIGYYQKAADLGDALGLTNIGYSYYFGTGVEQDYGKALEYFRKAADLGEGQAVNNLGDMYENGIGVEQDYVQAMKYYQQAAELGEGYAYAGIGSLYRGGKGVEQDLLKAAEYYKKALELGVDDPVILQDVKELSESLRRAGAEARDAEDYGKAMELFLLAAELGNAEGWRDIGDLYESGLGVEKDPDQAAEYYQKALDAESETEEEAGSGERRE